LLSTRKPVETVPVRAPFGGVVVGFDKVLGQAVRADEPVVPVHDLTKPLVRAFVSERDLALVRVGQAARVRFVADPATAWEGTVVRTAGVLDGGSQAVSVWVELKESTQRRARCGTHRWPGWRWSSTGRPRCWPCRRRP
jgi:Cu(I)/Ag(I) efflux system membrane fusion protein